MSYVLIIGATSDIARALARKYAGHGYDLYLAARQPRELTTFAKDLAVATGRTVTPLKLDILDFDHHQEFYDRLKEKPQGAICAIGYLGDQHKAQVDFREAKLILDTNYTGIAGLFDIIAGDFEQRRDGFLVGISSVAGDRGRKSNYHYGAAKAALTTYLAGLRNRLHSARVHVLTVKPGFVATRMTRNLNLPKRLTAQPDEVAADIFRAQQRNRDVLYTRWIWRWLMLGIRMIPEWQFKTKDL